MLSSIKARRSLSHNVGKSAGFKNPRNEMKNRSTSEPETLLKFQKQKIWRQSICMWLTCIACLPDGRLQLCRSETKQACFSWAESWAPLPGRAHFLHSGRSKPRISGDTAEVFLGLFQRLVPPEKQPPDHFFNTEATLGFTKFATQ